MSVTSPNMSLVRWTAPNDRFNHAELAANFQKIDEHDHTGAPGKGVQIPTAGIANLAITTVKLADVSVTTAKLADLNVTSPKIANQAVTAAKIGVLPHARVFHNTTQTLTSGTLTTLAFNSERWDSDGIHDTATNNSRLTCKTVGLYRLFGHVEFAAVAGGYRTLNLVLNDATVIASARMESNGGSITTRLSVNTDYRLAVNDYVTLVAHQDSGASVDITASTQISPEFGMTFLSNY